MMTDFDFCMISFHRFKLQAIEIEFMTELWKQNSDYLKSEETVEMEEK